MIHLYNAGHEFIYGPAALHEMRAWQVVGCKQLRLWAKGAYVCA